MTGGGSLLAGPAVFLKKGKNRVPGPKVESQCAVLRDPAGKAAGVLSYAHRCGEREVKCPTHVPNGRTEGRGCSTAESALAHRLPHPSLLACTLGGWRRGGCTALAP